MATKTKQPFTTFAKCQLKQEDGKLFLMMEFDNADLLSVVGGFAQTGISIGKRVPRQGAPIDQDLVPIEGQESTPRQEKVTQRQPQKRRKGRK